jgi:hypothetical protein
MRTRFAIARSSLSIRRLAAAVKGGVPCTVTPTCTTKSPFHRFAISFPPSDFSPAPPQAATSSQARPERGRPAKSFPLQPDPVPGAVPRKPRGSTPGAAPSPTESIPQAAARFPPLRVSCCRPLSLGPLLCGRHASRITRADPPLRLCHQARFLNLGNEPAPVPINTRRHKRGQRDHLQIRPTRQSPAMEETARGAHAFRRSSASSSAIRSAPLTHAEPAAKACSELTGRRRCSARPAAAQAFAIAPKYFQPAGRGLCFSTCCWNRQSVSRSGRWPAITSKAWASGGVSSPNRPARSDSHRRRSSRRVWEEKRTDVALSSGGAETVRSSSLSELSTLSLKEGAGSVCNARHCLYATSATFRSRSTSARATSRAQKLRASATFQWSSTKLEKLRASATFASSLARSGQIAGVIRRASITR